ncbi:MAG: long-chain fatty acid--CoA ligase [Deltaproteobacteria bacterium]|nr:MAG: long-chain fatty acid--CoA ligase [Deltaproteobacteria bacterium]
MSIPQIIRDCSEKWKDNAVVKTKIGGTYKDISWGKFYNLIARTATALANEGLNPGDKAAIMSHTRYEWTASDAAILTAGGIVVPIYPNLTATEAKRLIERSHSSFLFVSDPELVNLALSIIDDLDFVKKVIVFEDDAMDGVTHPKFIALSEFANIEADMALIDERLSKIKNDDIFTIIFTSGTTGEPKGVMLTHNNIRSNAETALELFDIGLGDIHLSHLPLAHVLERMASVIMLISGATTAYAEHITKVADNLQEVKPTVSVSVPRIFEKINAAIRTGAMESPAPRKQIAYWALDIAERAGKLWEEGKKPTGFLSIQFSIADKLVYSKIRERFGGRIRYFISGGAPLAPELATFFNTIGIPVYEGYGLTETSPIISANRVGNQKSGSVGPVIPRVEVKLAEDGEIIVKGPNVFRGYFEDEEATKAALTPDGWFSTGDIGRFDDEGRLYITDRKKDLIVTAGGKNIAPQKIENVLKLDKYFEEVMVYGDAKKFISALIVPDFEMLKKYADHKKLEYTDSTSLVSNPEIIALVDRRIKKHQKDNDFASYESVKKFVLLDHPFSAGDGEVTPTLKMRRANIINHYKEALEALYYEE